MENSQKNSRLYPNVGGGGKKYAKISQIQRKDLSMSI